MVKVFLKVTLNLICSGFIKCQNHQLRRVKTQVPYFEVHFVVDNGSLAGTRPSAQKEYGCNRL